jgi:hypothetical protein
VELDYQDPQRVINIMFGGTWAVDSHCFIKSMYWDIADVASTPKSTTHLKWVNTLITFDASDYLENMTGQASYRWSPPQPLPMSRCIMC